MSETAAERLERHKISDAKILAEMNAQGSGVAPVAAPKPEEPQGRTLKVVKAEAKAANKSYKEAVLSHKAVMKQAEDLLIPSRQNKKRCYDLKLALAAEKKAMGGTHARIKKVQ